MTGTPESALLWSRRGPKTMLAHILFETEAKCTTIRQDGQGRGCIGTAIDNPSKLNYTIMRVWDLYEAVCFEIFPRGEVENGK